MQSLGYLEEVLQWDEDLKPLYVMSIDDIPIDSLETLPAGLYIFCNELGEVFARHISLGEFGRNW